MVATRGAVDRCGPGHIYAPLSPKGQKTARARRVYELQHTAKFQKHLPSSRSSAACATKSPAGGGLPAWQSRRCPRHGFSGRTVEQMIESVVPSRYSISTLLCRRWWNSWWVCSSSSMRFCLLPSRLSKCPRSSSRTSLRDSRVANRCWRNSWWKCRPSCAEQTVDIPIPGGGGRRQQGFSPQNRIQQQVSNRSLVLQFQVEVFLVPVQDRVRHSSFRFPAVLDDADD